MVDLRAGVLSLALLLFWGQALLAESASAAPCGSANAIVCENSKPGNPPEEWDVSGAGDPSIQGFATDISVDQGETVRFKVDTDSGKYHLDIYRMGYYDGDGARKVDTVQPSASLPQKQPPCDEEGETGLVDCGNWAESASWAVPSDAVSGIYFAKLVRDDKPSSEGSHIVFVVRDDDGHSDLLFQTSDTTWQAYNQYGGNSLYEGGPGTNPSRAYKVSYNRPLTTRGPTPEDDPFSAEYPMVRWLERNGYDVSYFTGVDADRRGSEMLEHKAYLSVGHDEYWSATQRANVEAARNAGVNLAFFSGNEVFWKTRWEDSIDGSGTHHRTLVCYKETHANKKIDPEEGTWTGTWRDPRFSPPADGGQPENALTGTIFTVNSGTAAIKVPAADGKLRLWRKTSIASLEPGQTATLAAHTLGYEWDEDLDNGFRPPGLTDLSSTTVEVPQRLLDYGSNYDAGAATHHLTLYRAPSGALVFGAGTVQWSWGLDGEHDREESTPDPRMQQATVNLLADMGVQPGTLQGDLAPATQTTDSHPPTSTIAAPVEDAEIESGQPFTISGSATDTEGETGAGGQVGGVEVSVDGGNTWHPASGRGNWTYSWTPNVVGDVTIMSRAVDDSGNLETPGDQVGVNVIPASCPCSIWADSFSAPEDSDSNAVEVGVKLRADDAGFITGIRFYKTPGNGGTHVGHLWTAAGDQLAEVTFTGETASGWQQAIFDKPVAIEPDTTYVASYYAPTGSYASLSNFFSLVGVDNPPLHALAEGVDGSNGLFKYGQSGEFFSEGGPSSFQSTNYLVDVVFERQLEADTTPPVISSRSPKNTATGVGTGTSVSATFNEAMDPATVTGSTVELRNPSNDLVASTVSYHAGGRQVTLDPEDPLQHSTTYTARIKGGPGGVSDLAGNRLAANATWSFTTAPPPPPPPDEGPGGPILVISNAGNPFSRYYAEILRAEGLNEFTASDISNVTPSVLGSHDVAILGEGELSAGQAQMLSDWVQQGGNLIAMRPDSRLAGLLGLTAKGGTLANGYLQVDTGSSPGAGIVGETIQFHGTADRYSPSGAQTIATLYSDASTPTSNPAVTLRSVGQNGGQAAAFSYDLAKSVIYTRQGNPAWAGQERDGVSPIRPNDLFFGAKAGDEQPDWVNLNKVQIPQADEQQRLLTNLIERMNVDRKPLPRFWFLPHDKKAAIVMSGDDHAHGGTVGRFEHYKELDSPNCVVADWECVRSTSYVFPNSPITDAEAASFTSEGFEVGLHVSTNCDDWIDRPQLESIYSRQIEEFAASYPSLPSPSTNRMHCIVWSDWATQPKVELEDGIRLDTTYYYWPSEWIQNRPGMFTGSGMPMRFADLDGSMINVYQAATQMTDESGQTYPFTSDTLLDHALGPDGFYGVFAANMHTDEAASPDSDAVIASARERGVPVVSARQMLTWLDGRNQSSFGSIVRSGEKLNFTISPGNGARGLRAMLPTTSSLGDLTTIERDGVPVPTITQTIKGVEYAFFDAAAGNYTATYPDETPPVISGIQAAVANDGTATISWDTDEPADSRVDYGTDPKALGSSQSSPGLVNSHSVHLSGLDPNTTYYFRVASADAHANSSTEPNPPLGPQSFLTDPAPPELSATVPASPANNNSPKLIGSAAPNTTIHLYTGASCAGSPIATASAAELEAGIEVSVPDNTSTTFSATATSAAANTSACSAPIAYLEDSSAPGTQIDSNPSTLTNSAAASFAFTGSDGSGSGIASFECRLDSNAPGAWAPCASPKSYTNLPDGAHKFEVRAIDKAANTDASPATFSWSVDTKAPEALIDSGPAGLTNDPTPTFGFHSEPGASFECSIDTGTPSFGPCSGSASHTPASPLSDGPHTFRVRAADPAGNQASATRDFTVDSAAPDTQITDQPNSLTNSANASFSFTGNDGSGSGIASFECRLDSNAPGAWTACTSPQPYTFLTDGPRSFEVRAIDKAGNADASPKAFTWTIDTKAPAVAIDSLSKVLLGVGQSSEVSWHANENASFQLRVGGSDCDSGTVLDSGPYNAAPNPHLSNVSAADLQEGSNTLRLCLTDAAGNRGQASATLSKDTQSPDTQITSHPTALTNSASASFAFTGSDGSGSGIASLECRLDSNAPGAWAPCASPKSYTSLAEGSHSFEVRAIDKAANTDASPATFSWSVDTKAPEALIDSGPAGLTNDPTPTFGFHSEPGASFECSIDTGTPSFGPCSGSASHTPASPLSDGPHTFRVRAADPAGNQASATRDFTVDTQAPDTQITGHPTALTNSAAASFAFIGNDGSGSGIASFECRLDSNAPGAWAPCASPKNYTNLPDGAHKFEVRAIDKAANTDASPATFSWSVDTKAPEVAIDSLSKALLGAGQTSEVSWHANENASFELRVGGADCNAGIVLDSGPYNAAPNPHLSNVSAADLQEGSNTLRLCLTDAAGNRGQASATLSKDTQSPDTQIIDHPTTLTNSAAASFAFSGNDGSGSGIASLECRLDSGAWAPCTSPKNYTSLAEGSHSFEVRAIDKAANTDASPATFSWSIDTAAPSPPDLSATVPASPANNNSPKLIGSAAPNTTIHLYTGASCAGSPFATASAAELEAGITVSVPDNTSTTFSATATSAAANSSACSTPIAYLEDSSAPETQIDSNPSTLTNSAAASFAFSGNDGSGSGIASFECRLDSNAPGAWAPCASPKSYTNLPDGAHSFEVRAIDKAANTDASPATFSWSVDTKAPEALIDSGPAGLTNDPTPTFGFHSEPGASFECSIDTGTPSFGPCSGSASHTPASPLSDGPHTFRIRATDPAGNQASATRDFTVDSAAPDTQITGHPTALTNSAAASFAFTGNDGSGSGIASFECRLDSNAPGAWAPCSSPLNYANLSDGGHAFEVRAIDLAGNTDATPATFSWTVDTEASQTQITFHPPVLTNSASASFAFTGSDGSGSGIASFECRLDSGSWAICTSPRDYTSLSNGAHSFEVKAIDHAANTDASPATFSWTIDTAAPSPPDLSATVPASPANNNSPKLIGSAAPNTTIHLYTGASCAGSPFATASAAELEAGITVSVPDNTSTTFSATATSAAANSSACSTPIAYLEDSSAPETQIDSNPSTLTNSAAASFAFTGSDGSGSGIASFECRLDSGSWTTCTSPHAYASLSDGAHSFEVRAIDQAGNADASAASFIWTVDTEPADIQAPDTQLTDHPAALTNSASASFSFTGSDPGGSGVASFECRLDSSAPGAWTTCGSPKSYAGLAGGAHAFEVRAIDVAGNTDASPVSFGWTIKTQPSDTQAPDTQITTHPSTVTNSVAASFAFSGNDGAGSGIASFQCRLDSSKAADWAPCSSPRSYTKLSGGRHSFEVRAIDQVGNIDQSPASFSWTIKTTKSSAKASPSSPARVIFVRTRRDTRKGTALLIFKVPGPGRLSASAPDVSLRKGKSNAGTAAKSRELKVRQRGIKPQSIRVTRAGRAKLPIKLTPAGRKLLEENGKVKVAVLIRFRSIDGSSAARKMTVTLRKKETPQK